MNANISELKSSCDIFIYLYLFVIDDSVTRLEIIIKSIVQVTGAGNLYCIRNCGTFVLVQLGVFIRDITQTSFKYHLTTVPYVCK